MLTKFDKYVEEGLISRKVSPCGKLVLFDYTEKCQFEKAWDEITLNARGTVYELSTGAVIARAFPKFFNFSELTPERQSQLLHQKFTVAEKMDGSLGIVYFYDGEWRVNTRGSFVSDQAIKAKEMLQPHHKQYMVEGLTYLIEIIYPENRIVVDYNGEEKLVFLACLHNDGTEWKGGNGFEHWAKEYKLTSVAEIIVKLKELSFNEEGYVVKFADGTRAKFKGDEYVKMHRIVTGMSPLVLWESMKAGKVCRELLASIPEEFRPTYEKMTEKLEQNYSNLYNNVEKHCFYISVKAFDNKSVTLCLPENKRTVGIYTKENPHELNCFVFPWITKKGLDEMIRKEIKPKGNVL